MSRAKVDVPLGRFLKTPLTWQGSPRQIFVTLNERDMLEFTLEGFGDAGKLELMPLFWQALRQNPDTRKHPLQPRALKGRPRKTPGPRPDKFYACQYGVSTRTISMWRHAGAPLSNPDAMGDYIFTIKLRKQNAGRDQRRKVVLR